jgi:hypothetical protein
LIVGHGLPPVTDWRQVFRESNLAVYKSQRRVTAPE